MENLNRIIKFRAWDTQEKEMREVAMLRWEDGRMSRIAGYWKGTHNNGWTDYDPQEGKYELMQYTGIKDKNGVEIYESDYLSNGEYEYIVEWDNKYLCWIGRNASVPTRRDLNWSDEEISVWGNIYQNKELLD